MIVQILLIILAVLSILIGVFLKNKAELFLPLFKDRQKEALDFLQQFSHFFLILGIIGIPVVLLNRSMFSILYLLLLLALSGVFGFLFSKRI